MAFPRGEWCSPVGKKREQDVVHVEVFNFWKGLAKGCPKTARANMGM
jgi:hypothetical protein